MTEPTEPNQEPELTKEEIIEAVSEILPIFNQALRDHKAEQDTRPFDPQDIPPEGDEDSPEVDTIEQRLRGLLNLEIRDEKWILHYGPDVDQMVTLCSNMTKGEILGTLENAFRGIRERFEGERTDGRRWEGPGVD
jgi:hypothetical protein